MKFKPTACEGCPFYAWEGFLHTPQPLGAYGVLLVGEALGETEAVEGRPFAGKAGFVLDKLIRHAGLERSGFGIANAVFCRPPDNKLSGETYEQAAIWQCHERHLIPLVRASNPRVIVPMGALALSSLLGRKDIMDARGYHWDHPLASAGVYPTVHPSYILRGNGNFGTVFIHDLQRAVELAAEGWRPAPTQYCLDPTPEHALQWVADYVRQLENDPQTYLAYDIETPYKDEEAEEGSLEEDERDNVILRISFSYRNYHALSIPWGGAYLPAIQRALGTAGPKVVWNDGFDSPRIRGAGVSINGPVHDGMVAWHVLESDLPKSLRFVASMLLPHQPPWKHLAKEAPAFYNATDSDVEHQLLHLIFAGLRKADMWHVYDRHILQLAPIFARLSARGMPLDADRRARFADTLATRLSEVQLRLTAAVPAAARKIAHVYKNDPSPAIRATCLSRPATRSVPTCSACGAAKPRKDHFRALKKRVNPCAGATARMQQVEGIEYYRLAPFVPSKDQLLRYCAQARIKPITRRGPEGQKTTFDENAIRTLALRHPTDALFPIILEYREVDKIAGTYIGRPGGNASGPGREGPHDVHAECVNLTVDECGAEPTEHP